jgi:surface protein
MYCNTCEKNICIECENEHSNHNLISYGSVFINTQELLNQQNKIKEIALCIKEKGNLLINQINKIIEDIDKYKDISIDIINNYMNNKKRNYEKLINIKDLISNNNKLFEEIKKIDDNNLKDILNLEINYEDTIKYKINNNQENIKLFGNNFVDNNCKNCSIVVEGKEYRLTEYFDIKNIKNNNNDILTIKLKGFNNINNMNYMFDSCWSLSSLPDFSKWNTNNVKSTIFMFNGCSKML